MRALIPFAALAALAFAQSASAATVNVANVAFSPDFEETLQEELGPREGAYLQREVTEAVSGALARAGAQIGPSGQYVVDIVINDASPNRPTMQQLRDTPGLDWGRSFSIGGADLHAVLRTTDGQVVAEIDHEYKSSFEDVLFTPGPWSDAQRTIRAFAAKVARAYTENVR